MNIGDRVGRLVVVGIEKRGRGHRVTCKCDCGNEINIALSRLIRIDGHRRVSCGARTCDGRYKTPLGPATRIKRGYREICVGGRWRGEHRVVVENRIGRKLKKVEHVHHINGNRLDNRFENLEVIDQSTHSRKHLHVLRELGRLRKENKWLREQLAALTHSMGNFAD